MVCNMERPVSSLKVSLQSENIFFLRAKESFIQLGRKRVTIGND
jgi:hypothetical protein